MKLQKVMALLILIALGLWAGVGCVTETSTPEVEATPQETAAATEVVQATEPPVSPTDTPESPSDTAEPPTETPPSPTGTSEPPPDTPASPTATPDLPPDTPVPPTDTAGGPPDPPTATNTPPPTDTAIPPTDIPTPTPQPAAATATASPAVAFYQQGASLFEQQQWDAAIAEFQKAVEADPGFALTYMGLGYSYAAKNEAGPAIENFERYLELAPQANNRAQVEAFIAQLQGPTFNVPPGKALFVFYNYTERTWDIDVGSYFLQIPGKQPDQDYNVGTLVIDPGTYTWQGHSVDGDQYIGQNRNKGFEFTVEAGDVQLEGVR